MKRTAHKFAEIWKDGSHFVMKTRGGKYVEISNPTSREFIQIGGEYDTAAEAMAAAAPRLAKFIKEKVITDV
jgi:O-acetylhomoserine/O-acetylserine sulfhydrylase-like pyridoxal-dependent enzyme